jgi:zinc transporter
MPPVKATFWMKGEKQAVPGLVWAWRFGATSTPIPLPLDHLVDLQDAGRAWFWLHFDLVDMRAHHWLTNAGILPDSARVILLSTKEQPILQSTEGTLAGALPDLVREIEGISEHASQLRFVLMHNIVVTGWHHVLQATLEVQQSIEQGQTVATPGGLLQLLLDQIAANIADRLHILSEGLDKIEDQLLTDATPGDNLGLARQRRNLIRERRYIAGMRMLLERSKTMILADHMEPPLRFDGEHCQSRFSSLDHEAMAMLERARLLQDEIATNIAAATNRNLHALSILTALLLPPSLVFGAFGMNVGGLPLAQTQLGFLVASTLGLFSAGFVYALLRLLTRFFKHRRIGK